MTAQLECLLDDVVIGKQEMVGAIDAVCDVAQRIIGKLTNGAPTGGAPLLGPGFGGAGANRPPTPAMKRFAVAISRQKRVSLPAGYATSGSICRAFLQQHAPRKTDEVSGGEIGPKPASPAQLSFAEKIAQEKGIVIPDKAKASSSAMSAWINTNQGKQRAKRKTGNKPSK